MDRRKILEKVKAHLLNQGSQARHEDGNCQYLTENQNRCAIGSLMPNGHPGLNYGQGVRPLLDKFPDLKVLLGVESAGDILFLDELRSVHDDYQPDEWLRELKYVEELYL